MVIEWMHHSCAGNSRTAHRTTIWPIYESYFIITNVIDRTKLGTVNVRFRRMSMSEREASSVSGPTGGPITRDP